MNTRTEIKIYKNCTETSVGESDSHMASLFIVFLAAMQNIKY